jgi:electron transport complex protein RnfB
MPMWGNVAVAIGIMTGIALIAGLLLSIANRQLPANTDSLVEKVNALLPQTQCAQCGYAGCRPYASAIVNDGENINLCPPGGQHTLDRLAALLGRSTMALAESSPSAMRQSVAVIEEQLCIGCTYCRSACPVDAIIGAHQFMHTVIASECTGCELCLAPCPVDCISLVVAA